MKHVLLLFCLWSAVGVAESSPKWSKLVDRTVDVSTKDGQRLFGRLTQLSNNRLVLRSTTGEERSLSEAEIRYIGETSHKYLGSKRVVTLQVYSAGSHPRAITGTIIQAGLTELQFLERDTATVSVFKYDIVLSGSTRWDRTKRRAMKTAENAIAAPFLAVYVPILFLACGPGLCWT